MFKIPPLQAYTFAFFIIAWCVELGLQYKRSIFHSQAGFFKCLDALWWAPVTFRTSCVEWWWRGMPGLRKLTSHSDFFVIYQVKGLVTRLKNHAEHDFFHKLVFKSFCKQDGYKMLMLNNLSLYARWFWLHFVKFCSTKIRCYSIPLIPIAIFLTLSQLSDCC